MDLDKSALEVKLKHARNQVDVEMKKRHRAETDFQHLNEIYRVPGCDRTVRELKEKYMRGKGFPPLDILDDDGTLAIYKAIQELPQPNKDTGFSHTTPPMVIGFSNRFSSKTKSVQARNVFHIANPAADIKGAGQAVVDHEASL
ncbi:Rac GTPase-activating protein 1 [Acipenser ruthenus]|uniref:Rac GTPase-activating protein 1 n=1 Tax=Acipenser ruthenus TaxID=7906 RepID=A0A444U2T3_ACIRT|nr:Rac GTPase-activating protein 1 [Acipenser ruthenus]